MADPIDIKIIHNLDEASKEMDDFIAKYNNKTINLNIKPPPEYAAPTPGASQSEKSPFEETSNDRILNRRYQQQTVEKYIPETLKYYKSFNSFSSRYNRWNCRRLRRLRRVNALTGYCWRGCWC